MLTDAPIYKHPIRPGTDEALIRAFKRENKMIRCRVYKCTMTEATCKARKARALKVPRTSYTATIADICKSDAYMSLERCAKCRRKA